MTTTLEEVREDIRGMRSDIRKLCDLIQHSQDESESVPAEVMAQVKRSRQRKDSEFISHEDVMKKHGVR